MRRLKQSPTRHRAAGFQGAPSPRGKAGPAGAAIELVVSDRPSLRHNCALLDTHFRLKLALGSGAVAYRPPLNLPKESDGRPKPGEATRRAFFCAGPTRPCSAWGCVAERSQLGPIEAMFAAQFDPRRLGSRPCGDHGFQGDVVIARIPAAGRAGEP